MNLIKTNLRNRLTNLNFDKRCDSLNSILRVTMSGISLESSRKEHPEVCVKCCFSAKSCRQGQQKRKLYEKPKSKKVKRAHFSISNISTDSDSPYSSQSEDEIIVGSFLFLLL